MQPIAAPSCPDIDFAFLAVKIAVDERVNHQIGDNLGKGTWVTNQAQIFIHLDLDGMPTRTQFWF